MQMLREHPWYADSNGQPLTLLALVVIALIATLDAFLIPDLGFAFLYFIPIFIAAAFMSRWWQILLISAVCTVFAESFSSFEPGAERVARVLFGFLGCMFVGVMSRRMAVFSRAASRRLAVVQEELSVRHTAAEQHEMLINSTPVAIVSIGQDGNIIFSNHAAHRVLGVEPGGLTGQSIGIFLPALDSVETTHASTIQCSGRRANGDPFLAFVALSTVADTARPTIAAFVLDLGKIPLQAEEADKRRL